MHTIEVDDQVFAHIEAHASGFSATPNTVLRHLLGLDGETVRPGRQGRSDHTGQGGPGGFGAGGPNGRGPSGPMRGFGRRGPWGPGGPGGPPRPRMRQPRASLSTLVEAGILTEGQRLVLKDFKGEVVEGVDAEVRDGQVWFNGRNWAMSKLAGRELGRRGYNSPAFRGPNHWFTEDGKSIRELWEAYLEASPSAVESGDEPVTED